MKKILLAMAMGACVTLGAWAAETFVFGPFGTEKDVVSDRVAPTIFESVSLTVAGRPAALGDCVAVYRKSDGSLCGLGMVTVYRGRPQLTLSLQAKGGTEVRFKVWQRTTGKVFDTPATCDIALPDSGEIVGGLTIVVR